MIHTIRNGLAMASQDISVISNNLANANSNGFKKSYSHFLDSYLVSPTNNPNLALGGGAQTFGPRRSHQQGELRPTASELDLAVSGTGMFVTRHRGTDGEVAFTRDGAMRLESDGYIATVDGRVLIGAEGQPLRVPLAVLDEVEARQPLTKMRIDEGGRIEAIYGDGTINYIGTIALAGFANVEGLRSIGSGNFVASDNSGAPRFGTAVTGAFGRILAGNLETSNTDVTKELVKLMRAQQAYSGSSRMLQAEADTVKRLLG